MNIEGYVVMNVRSGTLVCVDSTSSSFTIYDYLFDSLDAVHNYMEEHTVLLDAYVIVPVKGPVREFQITSLEL